MTQTRRKFSAQEKVALLRRHFKEFVRIAGMTHVRISPGYPQSNGKKERFFQTLKTECIRPGTPLSIEDARRAEARRHNEPKTS